MHNPLNELRAREFFEAQTEVVQLQQLIHSLAFYSMKLLIELDLSNNNTKKLHGVVLCKTSKLLIFVTYRITNSSDWIMNFSITYPIYSSSIWKIMS